jgi:hypothetical protein
MGSRVVRLNADDAAFIASLSHRLLCMVMTGRGDVQCLVCAQDKGFPFCIQKDICGHAIGIM